MTMSFRHLAIPINETGTKSMFCVLYLPLKGDQREACVVFNQQDCRIQTRITSYLLARFVS